jgi:catechol 2,3-dioxygenase-like lactoylglutathione lyase family enzyme
MNALFPLTVTDALTDARDFYVALFGFDVVVDVGWYVQLAMPDNATIQIAFIETDHDATPAGVAITAEVGDAAAVHAQAVELGLPVHGEPRDEEWGQRHFHTQDPTGLLVDVVERIPPRPEFLARYRLAHSNSAGG